MSRAFFAVLCLLAACGSRQSNPFPERDSTGWDRSAAPRTFDAKNLWQFIDGDAERYLQAGVRRALTAPYRHRSQLEAVADVYEMASPAGARRIFDAEPAEGSRPVVLGDAGRHYGQSLTFCKGPRFVRLTLYQEAPQGAEALTALAAAIDARLGPK
jgi:hypothetical protein